MCFGSMDDSSNGRALYPADLGSNPAPAPYEITWEVQPILMVASCPINNLVCLLCVAKQQIIHPAIYLFIYLLGSNKRKNDLQMKFVFECIDQ